jgi:pimeloyl-ACP methyl ester carboxylesterase
MSEKIILLHGALGSNAQFDGLALSLMSSFEVFAFNFDGHGGLVIKEPFSIDLFVSNTIAFMDNLQIKTAHFFGYSMGGYVALKLAHDFPDRVSRVVTLGTKFNWTPESAERDVRMMNPEIIEKKIPDYAATLAERHHPEDWKEVMQRTAEMMTRMGDGEAMTKKHFEKIEQEVLICIGTQDHMVSIDESERTADQLRKGRLQTIDGFKHPLEAVDHKTIANICTDFLLS